MTENSADKKPNKDYLDGYQNIEKQINDKLIKYLKALDFPENDMGFHMIIYKESFFTRIINWFKRSIFSFIE